MIQNKYEMLEYMEKAFGIQYTDDKAKMSAEDRMLVLLLETNKRLAVVDRAVSVLLKRFPEPARTQDGIILPSSRR